MIKEGMDKAYVDDNDKYSDICKQDSLDVREGLFKRLTKQSISIEKYVKTLNTDNVWVIQKRLMIDGSQCRC